MTLPSHPHPLRGLWRSVPFSFHGHSLSVVTVDMPVNDENNPRFSLVFFPIAFLPPSFSSSPSTFRGPSEKSWFLGWVDNAIGTDHL